MHIRPGILLAASAVGIALFLASAAPVVVTYDWVTVGDPGNANDANGRGGVAKAYRIGKYEVTNAQYTDYLNTVDPTGANPNEIYNTRMGSDARGGIIFSIGAANGSKYSVKANMGNKPVNYVSWFDAARFANWMNNGQSGGSTETGAYTLNGSRDSSARNPDATIWLPSENEWYKAAFYDPSPDGPAGEDDYWLYPTRSDNEPTVATANELGDISNPGANVANYASGADWNGQDGNVTTVGSAGVGSASYYGTFDQAGNVWEWNEAILNFSRGRRAGSFNGSFRDLRSASGFSGSPTGEASFIGFRLATVP